MSTFIPHPFRRSFFLILLVTTAALLVCTGAAEDTFDDSIHVARSNVVQSQVDPSFWEEREPLTISKLQKPLTLPTGQVKPTAIIYPSGSKPADSGAERAVLAQAQDVALILVNNPSYQAGVQVFKLDDKTQVKLSSLKYAATSQYYGRTDIASSWVTECYNAAYSGDYETLRILLVELPPEL